MLGVIWTIAEVSAWLILFLKLGHIAKSISAGMMVVAQISNKATNGFMRVLEECRRTTEVVDVVCHDGSILDDVKVEKIQDDQIIDLRQSQKDDGRCVSIPVFNISFIIRGESSR